MVMIALGVLISGCRPGNLGASTRGWAPVVVSEGTIYMGTKEGDVKALVDTDSGIPVVRWTFRPPERDNGVEGAYNPPVVGENFVYISAGSRAGPPIRELRS